jgi:hypothetical protein
MLHYETVGRAMREANTVSTLKCKLKWKLKMYNQHGLTAINSA